MSAPNPVERTFKDAPNKVSTSSFIIGGIKCTIFGLSELAPSTSRIACLWLLNPRLATQETMAPLAHSIVHSWNAACSQAASPGLIAVTFDQRNHGSRQVDAVANEAWRGGNGLHAQDMFSIYHGTSLDCSQLITYLPSYIFPDGDRTLDTHMVLGVSLGGHAVWHCLLSDPRITTGVAVIGCPDYLSLMTDRARLSKLETYTGTDPPGASFVGSRDFPTSLLDAVDMYDPAGLLTRRTMPMHQVDMIGQRLGGKRILNLAGGDDKLVPYAMGKQFLDWLKGMIGTQGAASQHDVLLVDKIFDGVGHEMSPAMVQEAISFIETTLKRHPAYKGDASKL